ncbi:hypothetical protein [Pseudactinotalea terrae]|uniref:hypothetical protein n=1 Tax=Pseudactinotalea terrae TaxID=1743262 RepID=UPI0012E1E432|nr:hypothetical protein [Pseudactinotalea terrae]
MAEPQRETPDGAAPSGPYGSFPPEYSGQPMGGGHPLADRSGDAIDASGYAAPDAYVDYSGRQVPPRSTSPALGWVALVAGLIALGGSTINALIAVGLLSPASLDGGAGNTVALLAIALLNGLLVWFLFGLWAIVQGIVALAQKRGVVQGIVAIGLGVVGPWVGIVLAVVLFRQAFATT